MITHTLNQFYADIVVHNTFHILIKTLLHISQKTHEYGTSTTHNTPLKEKVQKVK